MDYRGSVESDATLIFTFGMLKGGSLRTAKFARQHQKPYEHLNIAQIGQAHAVVRILEWLRGDGCNDYDAYEAVPPSFCDLNVAGSRESKAKGIQDAVEAVMLAVIQEDSD